MKGFLIKLECICGEVLVKRLCVPIYKQVLHKRQLSQEMMRLMIQFKRWQECHRMHTCKKREIPEIYLRKFFWIFRKILG